MKTPCLSLEISIIRCSIISGYYERMAHGGASLAGDSGDPNASQVGSPKGSTSMTIDSLSESEPQSQTSTQALQSTVIGWGKRFSDFKTCVSSVSQMDLSQSVSRGVRGRERRSGSRTSLGSRGKSLRLNTEQKAVIAHKEIERWEQRLSNFR